METLAQKQPEKTYHGAHGSRNKIVEIENKINKQASNLMEFN